MPPSLKKPRNPNKKTHEERLERSRVHQEEVTDLRKKVEELKQALVEDADKCVDGLEKFEQLPISHRTRIGLAKGNYKHLTHIQAAALPHALAGRDVMGAAKTGSGKTLAFLVPVIERLHLENWDGESGLGALVLTPTRELALQIFKVLQVIGCKHPYAAALLTGGRNVDEEKKRLGLMAVVIGTPGRILHHLSESSTLNVDNLQMLVLDEADRLLDMGFYENVTGILDQLPRGEARQTLLFSATQSSDVNALARLCLRDPIQATAHAQTIAPTPQNMNQNFMIVPLQNKMDALVAFLKRHPNDKTIVFANTCNQVRFMYLALSKLMKKQRVPMMCLTGKMKQFRRDEVFMTFCRCKAAVLFCTDIAARGLDFPLVHWVYQYDCPESVETYIHRAGRTARAGARGVSLLVLTPQEKAMLYFLHKKKIPLREIALRPHVIQDTHQLFVALVVQGLKFEAQKAFVSYLRSLKFASNKAVFRLDEIDLELFANSLGLLVVPDTSALGDVRSAKNLPWAVANYKAEMEKGAAAAEPHKTRRERHLEASDMFNAGLAARLKYTPHERLALDTEGDDLLVRRAPKPAAAAAADTSDEDDGADAVNDAAAAAENELSYEERIAGISKHKQRKLIKTADLKLKDLHLSKHVVFDREEEDDDDEADGEGDGKKRAVGTVAEAAELAEDDDDSDGALSEHGYAANLRSRLQAVTTDDADRVRALKRERRDKKLEKAGLLDKDAKKDKDGSDSEYDSDASASSFDSVTKKLLRAARGESVSAEDDSSDEDDDDDDEEEEQPQRRPPQPRRR